MASSPLLKLDLEKIGEISRLMDLCPLQDSLRYRARSLGLKLATLLIDEKGELDRKELADFKACFAGPLFVVEPNREGDALIFDHIRSVLFALEENWNLLRKFSVPLCHKKAEEFVRETLLPEPVRILRDVHVRRAVLASWLTLLRQATGSCFATAPAILIQQTHPKQLLKDLYELLSTGKLKRVIGGKEYMVPLSLSSGGTDLQKPLGPLAGSLVYSPGLREALVAAGMEWPAEIPPAETAEKLLRASLLHALDLTEEDIADEEHLARLQMTPLLTRNLVVHYQKPTARAQRVSDLKKRLAKATVAFQSFAECALLRAWEYTLASFCDLKVDFARWNLTIGLGLHPDQSMGIGSHLSEWVQERHQREEKEVERLHEAYAQAVELVQITQGMIRAAMSDAHRNQLKGELASYLSAANLAQEMRDKAIQKMEFFASLLSSLLQQYHDKLQEYFQELFDPTLVTDETHLIDDSPAGFRLVYKHGRTDATQWTFIHSGDQYIASLRDFFTSVEGDLTSTASSDSSLFAEVTTSLIQWIQKPEFLESAVARSKKEGRRSPWDYISGGSLQTLLQSYCNRERPFTEEKIAPHSEEELLAFLYRMKAPEKKSILMHSPTHAFIFYPHLLSENPGAHLSRCRQLTEGWSLNEEEQEYLAHRLSLKLPPAERALFIHRYRQKEVAASLREFRANLIELIPLKNGLALADSFLFEELPLSNGKDALRSALSRFGIAPEEAVKRLDKKYLSSLELKQTLQSILSVHPISQVDWDQKIAEVTRSLGLSYPEPIFFADTNWSGWFFGFIANPATGALELWRLNRLGTQGYPMHDWKEWVSPTNTAPWIFLPRSEEYTDLFA